MARFQHQSRQMMDAQTREFFSAAHAERGQPAASLHSARDTPPPPARAIAIAKPRLPSPVVLRASGRMRRRHYRVSVIARRYLFREDF